MASANWPFVSMFTLASLAVAMMFWNLYSLAVAMMFWNLYKGGK